MPSQAYLAAERAYEQARQEAALAAYLAEKRAEEIDLIWCLCRGYSDFLQTQGRALGEAHLWVFGGRVYALFDHFEEHTGRSLGDWFWAPREPEHDLGGLFDFWTPARNHGVAEWIWVVWTGFFGDWHDVLCLPDFDLEAVAAQIWPCDSEWSLEGLR